MLSQTLPEIKDSVLKYIEVTIGNTALKLKGL